MRTLGQKLILTVVVIVLILSVAILIFTGISYAGLYDQVSITVPISMIEVAKVQQVAANEVMIDIGAAPQGGSPGDPMLPFKTICLLVPPDADLETASASLISQSWEDLPGEYDIAPVSPAASGEAVSFGGKDPTVIVNGKDITIYGSNTYFPSESVQVMSVGGFRQWKLVELRVWLAVYNPVQKKVRLLKDAQARLIVQKLPAAKATGLNSAVLPVIPKTERFLPKLRAKIANPHDIDVFYGQQAAPAAESGGPAPSNVSADYVIITTNAIVNNSTKLANFIAAKQAAGFTVNTVTEAPVAGDSRYVQGTSCDTRANNIRDWLKNHYIPDGIEYVLLIGDPNPTAFTANLSVPMKMCWPRNNQASDKQAPSDMYFAELSNTWDKDGDGFYGEFVGDYGAGGADKDCELKVGRIPVYNVNCVDLDAILQKCIDYDTALGDKSWRSKVLIPAAVSNWQPQDDSPYDGIDDYSWGDTFGADWGEAIKTLASSISFSPYTLYEKSGCYADGRAYPLTACSAALTKANVKSEWQNHYGFVSWWGHGSQTGAFRRTWNADNYGGGADNWTQHPFETSDTAFFDSWDCPVIDNNYPSFVVQVSCNNGWPELNTNLGYSLLKQGAIGTISGTRVTWYSIGSWNTGKGANVSDNASYGYYCFDRMANVGEDIGTALVWCRSNFGTGWNDGASWMNMIEFSIYGDPSLSLDLPAGGGPKWKQDPDTSEKGMDIRCDRRDGINRKLADDFLCTTTGPITKIILWGSWYYDAKGTIAKIHLSIHDDKPDPDGPQGSLYSEPNTLLWSKDFFASDFTEKIYNPMVDEWWWDPYTMMTAIFPGDHQIWQYDINIPAADAFVQQGAPGNPIVYWLDAYVELDPCNSPETSQFGWKTSAQHWNDDSVKWDDQWSMWRELRYPSPHPDYTKSIDLAFAIITGEEPDEPVVATPHLKWEQPPIEVHPGSTNITFCGWDEKSYNKYYDPGNSWKIVADDFRCLGTMPITSIHWWGSYYNWEQPGLPPPANLPIAWLIGFWSNVPACTPPGNLPYSYPETLLHVFTVPASRVTVKEVGQDQYYGYYPNDTCFKYSLNLEPNEVFQQNDFNYMTQDNIYWLSITAVYGQQQEPYYPWGWKSRLWHWMDDSVTFNLAAAPTEGTVLQPSLITPITEPMFGESADMSFELDTDPNYIKWEQPFTGIRDWPHYEDVNSLFNSAEPANETLVADDWRCLRRTPVTAIVWFGSYIGYAYEACGTYLMPLPIKPDHFKLTVWTDVPANPGDPNSYSHPGSSIWQYVTSTYDEVFVGYDKYPHGEPNEPVFRYSVRLPEDKWFHQPDFNEVFWLSVQAVYDTHQPNYKWGWTNHQHMFNDGAVKGIKELSGQWQWRKVVEQQDNSADMSFILFTDPNRCSTCANYNCDTYVNFLDYADFADSWLTSVPPGGYDNSDLNCDGTINWSDVAILAQQWLGLCP